MNNPLQMAFTPLYTERLVLRQLTIDDEKEIMVLRSDERILRHLLMKKCESIHEARAFIEKINTSVNNNEAFYWGITRKEGNNKLTGTICIWNVSKENCRAEIGYVLHPDWQGKGLMNEAIESVLNFAFTKLNLHSMEAQVAPGNVSSIKLLEKKGFKKEAHFRENVFSNGRFYDTVVYSLLDPGK